MIHLFKKVYVSSDKLIDLSLNRVVVSERFGYKVSDSLNETAKGFLIIKGQNFDEIIGQEKEYTDWESFFKEMYKFQNETLQKVMIYCDDASMMRLLSAWFKLILPNSTKISIKSLIESYIFKYNVFHKGRFSTNNGNLYYDYTVDTTNFSNQYDSLSTLTPGEFITEIKSNVGVEFLLASYLKNKSYKDELKNVLKILITKDLEKYLYELKEIFFVHILTNKFTNKLNLNKTYNFENFTEIENDGSKFVELFINERIWNYKYMSHPSSTRQNINLKNITEEDKKLFKEFTTISGSTWNEEDIYSFVKSDINKLDFLQCFNNFTDELLDKIIETESNFEHAAGSFFSIDLESVNHYLISEILEAHKNKDEKFITNYSLE